MIIALCLSCVPNIWAIIAGRLLLGAVGALGRVIIPLFVKDITPVEVYGLLGGFDKILYIIFKYQVSQ